MLQDRTRFFNRLGNSAERYDLIMSLTRVPELNDVEKMILGELVNRSSLPPRLIIENMPGLIMDADSSSEEDRRSLRDKAVNWNVAERIAATELIRVDRTTRTCRQCKATFLGGTHAQFCPSCRVQRAKIGFADYRARRKTKGVRTLGSTDTCSDCGKTYTINSGKQRYCTECQRKRGNKNPKKIVGRRSRPASEIEYMDSHPYVSTLRKAYIMLGLDGAKRLTVKQYHSTGLRPFQAQMCEWTEMTWSQLCESAGIPASSRKKDISEEEILYMVQEAARLLNGEAVTFERFNQLQMGLSATAITYRLKCKWKDVCKMAGVKVSHYGREPGEPIARLRKYLLNLGYVPQGQKYAGKPTLLTLGRHGYTYREAVEKAGFDYEKSRATGLLFDLE